MLYYFTSFLVLGISSKPLDFQSYYHNTILRGTKKRFCSVQKGIYAPFKEIAPLQNTHVSLHSRKRYSRENVQSSLNHSSLVTNVILQFQPNERNIACAIKVQSSCSHFPCLSYDKFYNIKVKVSFRLIIVPPKYLHTFFRTELENASNGI